MFNNPLKYTDPSGELAWFVPIIIGAVIGGGSAAIQGGNFGDILKGALIGGASAFIGMGVANVVAGGAFIGNAAMTASGFWSGAASGFAGGFAGGFVGGAFTSWFNGASFGKGIVAGLKGGMIGGVIGGAISGISAGINAVKQGKNFWTGRHNAITTGGYSDFVALSDKIEEIGREWDIDIEMDIKNVRQTGRYDCTHACKKAVDRYFGISDVDVNKTWYNIVKDGGLVSGDYNRAGDFYQYMSKSYLVETYSGAMTPDSILPWMNTQMTQGRVVQVGWYPSSGGGLGHASIVTRLRYMNDFSRMRISLMNPAIGGAGVLTRTSNIYNIFSIWKR